MTNAAVWPSKGKSLVASSSTRSALFSLPTPSCAGIEPAPQRKRQTTWHTFLKAHWQVLAAVDFTTVEVWTKNGLITFYLLVVMELATRRVHFAGTTVSPEDPWMKQIARNLSTDEG